MFFEYSAISEVAIRLIETKDPTADSAPLIWMGNHLNITTRSSSSSFSGCVNFANHLSA